MANRRMFAKTITNSGSFLMLPSSAQLLYFHLGMNADDDGFVESYTVMNTIRAQEGDLEILVRKNFLQLFENLVAFIIGWRENNEIRKDRYQPSKYQYLMPSYDYRGRSGRSIGDTTGQTRFYIEQGGADVGSTSGNPVVTQAYDKLDTQDRLGKDRLGKVNKKNNKKESFEDFVKEFNNLRETRFKATKALQKLYNFWLESFTHEEILQATRNIPKHQWLKKIDYTPTIFLRTNKDWIDQCLNLSQKQVGKNLEIVDNQDKYRNY